MIPDVSPAPVGLGHLAVESTGQRRHDQTLGKEEIAAGCYHAVQLPDQFCCIARTFVVDTTAVTEWKLESFDSQRHRLQVKFRNRLADGTNPDASSDMTHFNVFPFGALPEESFYPKNAQKLKSW